MASMVEIAGYAYKAGLRDAASLSQAVAIAMAESTGNPNAHNNKGRDNSYGLWQINMKAHTLGELGISTNEALYDPLVNAKAMVKISRNGTHWTPWSTFPLRSAAFLPVAIPAVATFLAGPLIDTAGGVVEKATDATGIGSLAQSVSEATQTPLRIANWLTDSGTWTRIALFGIGGAMIIAGVSIFARPAATAVLGDAAKIGSKLMPASKAATIAGKVT